MKTISIRLDEKTIEAIKDRSIENGETISETIRSIIMEAREREGLHAKMTALEARLDGLSQMFRELDGLRRFREVYAQIKRSNIGLDELSRILLGDQKHAGWKTHLEKEMKQAAVQATVKKD